MRRLLFLALLAAPPLFATEIAVTPPVMTPAARVDSIAAASDGINALAVWLHSDGAVRYALVRPGGAGGDLAARPLPEAFSYGFQPLVAFAGGRYLIVWQTYPGIAGMLLDRDGNVVRRVVLASEGRFPVLAGGNGCFLLGWIGGVSNYATIVSPEGDVVATSTLPFRMNAACPSADGFAAVLFPYQLSAKAYRLPVVRISAGGRIGAQAEIERPTEDGYEPASYSVASGSDGGLLIAWDQPRRAAGFLTDFALRSASADFDFGSSDHRPVAAMWDGARYLVFTSSDLRVTRVGFDRQSRSNGWLAYGAVVKTSAGYVVFTSTDLIVVPMTASVHADILSPPLAVWHFPVVTDQFGPQIATDGRSILVSWDYRESALLPWPGGVPRSLSMSFGASDFAFDGAEFVALGGCTPGVGCSSSGTSVRLFSPDDLSIQTVELPGSSYVLPAGSLFFGFSGVERPGLAVRRFRRSGVAVDAAPIVVLPSGYCWIQSMATNGRDAFLIISRDNKDFVLARVTADGAVTLGESIPLTVPKIAVAGDVVFVTAWKVNTVVVTSYTADLHARWPAPLEMGPGWLQLIAADGRNAVMAWLTWGSGIFGAHVTPEGEVQPFTVLATTDTVYDLDLATGGGLTAVAYVRLATEEPYLGAARVFVQVFPPPPRRRPSV